MEMKIVIGGDNRNSLNFHFRWENESNFLIEQRRKYAYLSVMLDTTDSFMTSLPSDIASGSLLPPTPRWC